MHTCTIIHIFMACTRDGACVFSRVMMDMHEKIRVDEYVCVYGTYAFVYGYMQRCTCVCEYVWGYAWEMLMFTCIRMGQMHMFMSIRKACIFDGVYNLSMVTHACIHTQTCIHTCNTQTCIYTCIRTCTHAVKDAVTPAGARAHTRTHTYARTCIHTRTHTHTHIRTHTHTHTHMHTHTHTHTLSLSLSLSLIAHM